MAYAPFLQGPHQFHKHVCRRPLITPPIPAQPRLKYFPLLAEGNDMRWEYPYISRV